MQDVQGEQQQAMAQQQQMELTKQAGQLAQVQEKENEFNATQAQQQQAAQQIQGDNTPNENPSQVVPTGAWTDGWGSRKYPV